MTHSHTENIYIHQNFNKNQIKSVLLENATHETRPVPERNKDRGLLYFDTEIGRIIVWDGTEWKIVRYFDDRDITNIEDVQITDVWSQTGQVGMLSESDAQGISGTQSVVKYFSEPTGATGATGFGLTMSHIPGSWSFYHDDMKDVVFPRESSGAMFPDFYKPVLRNKDNCIINSNDYVINEYKVRNKTQYRVEFKDGKIMKKCWSVDSNNLPKITFYKYIGERLQLDYIQGSVSKFRFFGTQFSCYTGSYSTTDDLCEKVRVPLAGTFITSITDIRLLTANGQEIYPKQQYDVIEVPLNSGDYNLIIDMRSGTQSGTGWQGEGGLSDNDIIYITKGKVS